MKKIILILSIILISILGIKIYSNYKNSPATCDVIVTPEKPCE